MTTEFNPYQPHKLTDENLAFLHDYVTPCEEDGHCDEKEDLPRGDTLDIGSCIPLRITPDGHNFWNDQLLPVDDEAKKNSKIFKICIGCLHPIGSFQTRELNAYLGHKAPSIDEVLDFDLEEIDLDF